MTFDELVAAAKDRRSVRYPKWRHPKAAAFILHMPGARIVEMLPTLTLHKAPDKPNGPKPAKWFEDRAKIAEKAGK